MSLSEEGSRVYEIGGADRVSYAEIMRAYARLRGRRIVMIPVPVLTPFLSSLWLGLVTPLYARIGRTLIESIVHSTVVRDEARVRGVRHPADGNGGRATSGTGKRGKGVRHDAVVRCAFGGRRGPIVGRGAVRYATGGFPDDPGRGPPAAAMAPVRRIGGTTGWYAWNGLWKLRGFLDLLVGGVGMRRGRVLQDEVRVGDPLDFWRVEAFEPDRLLRLAAEMKLPGRAWLEFEVTGTGGSSTIRQTAIFDPVGLFGLMYWYALYPVHQLVFGGMLRGIAAAALKVSEERSIQQQQGTG